MNSHKTDFQLSENDNAAAFFEFLDDVPENINENTVDHFFTSCINFLNKESISITSKYKIICSLVNSLSSQTYIESFINGNYLSQLPFKLFNAQEKILDIIYIVTNYAPNGINNDVAIKFGHLITRYPRKCLTILSIFSERFQISFKPWKMVDLLFSYCDTFLEPECVDDYISILLYLNSNFESFRESRLKHTWFAFSQIIQKSKLDCSKTNAYYAMCQLYELRPRIVKKCPFPESAPNDLFNPNLQKGVISLLLRCSPNQVAEPTIQSLLKIKNENCLEALLVLTENLDCAQILINDLDWLREKIPTIEGTMKIFAKLLKFGKYNFIKSPNVVTFLNNIVNNGNDPENVNNESLIAASVFVRSLPINNRFVGHLSNEDFLTNYFNIALQRTEKPVVDSTISLIDAIAKRGDAIELSDVCDFIKENVFSNNPAASKAAADLALYPRCAKEFQKNGLAEYFEKNQKIPNANDFLSNYRNSVKRPVRAPPVVSAPQIKKSVKNSTIQSPVKNQPQTPQSPKSSQPVQSPQSVKASQSVKPSKTVQSPQSVRSQQTLQSPKQQDQEQIKTRNILLPKSEPKPEPKTKSQPEPESETKSDDESYQKDELESDSDYKTKNEDDEVLLPENSSDDSSIINNKTDQKPSALQTAPASPGLAKSSVASSDASSVVSSPSASGVYDPYLPPNSQVKSSPIAISKVIIEEEESESEPLVKDDSNQNKSESSETSKPSILQKRAAVSDDESSTSESENINPSLSPIKQRSVIPASPLNRSKIRSIGSIGSIGSADDSDIKKSSSSLINIELPPPEQHAQALLPDTFGGLTYIKQGSPPPKPRPSRNKE